MGGHVRGHYRIDTAGRVVPVTDVNCSLQSFVAKAPMGRDRAAEQKTRLTRICIVGFILCSLGLTLMASLPQIQHAIIARESARMTSIRKSFVKSHPGFSSKAAHHWNQALADRE